MMLWESVNVGDQPANSRFTAFGIPERLIDDLPFLYLNLRPSVIDDIYVSATEVAIDGNFGTLGRAGPVLTSGGIPVAGFLELDVDDVRRIATGDPNLLLNTITHEIGHIQGIGTVVSFT